MSFRSSLYSVLSALISFTALFILSCSRSEDTDLCDFQKGPCIKRINHEEVSLDIEPRPLQAFKETEFTVKINNPRESPEKLILELTMPGMFMGKNQVVLKKTGYNTYSGRSIIPRCPSGKTLWQADIGIPYRGEIKTVSFRFHVQY